MKKITVLLGASPKKDRYSYLAYQTLKEKGKEFVLVNPHYTEIEGHTVLPSLRAIHEQIDTLSIYISPEFQIPLIPEIVALKPRRVIFNPGSECIETEKALKDAGIDCLEACTLVLLRTGQYDAAQV